MKSKYRAEDRGYHSDETVHVQPTGILDDPRCITDLTGFCQQIKAKVDDLNGYLDSGNRISQIVIGGDPNIASRLDELTQNNVATCSYSECYKQFLDDDGEAVENANDIEPVRKTSKTVADALDEMGWLENSDQFDITEAEDRHRINRCVVKHLPMMRYRRAKEKSEARRMERIINDWFDEIPTADHVIVGYDGRTRKDWIVCQLHRNKSRHVKYPSKQDGLKLAFSADEVNHSYLDWDMAQLFVPDYYEEIDYYELSIQQRRHASLWLSPHERSLHEFPSAYEEQTPETEENFARQGEDVSNAGSTVTSI